MTNTSHLRSIFVEVAEALADLDTTIDTTEALRDHLIRAAALAIRAAETIDEEN